MKDQGKFIGGILLGVGLAYLLDPDRGARRRALLRDRATKARHRLAEELDATARDLRNRAGGAAAEIRSRFRSDDSEDVGGEEVELDELTTPGEKSGGVW